MPPATLDPELSLALGIASNPGVYAVLVGSGVSRSAGIPTGWEVVVDLVRKLASAGGEDPGPDPAAWYTSKFGESPSYSRLLERLGHEPAERQSLLRGYFEANQEERAQGIKMPTRAHRALADLVGAGWIRVILTTNFDRLLESALETSGVTPVVVATADQAEGAPPLAHSACTVIKLNGDYLDSRIKNSTEELASYAEPMEKLLDQVFDEYGLIVCGWSGAYDVALRGALERCESRRYSTYWCVRGTPEPIAQGLIAQRAALVAQIKDADVFFPQLFEQVTSIHQSGKRHPLETRVAVETLKRYLPEERYRIRLHELVREATEQLIGCLKDPQGGSLDDFPDCVQRLHASSECILALLANGSYWGRAEQHDVWVNAVGRLAAFSASGSRIQVPDISQYPGLLALYATGIGAVATGKYDLLQSVLLAPGPPTPAGERQAIVQALAPRNVLTPEEANALFPHPNSPNQKYRTPLSQYLERALRPTFLDLIYSDREYIEAFDRFEYLTSLVHAHLYWEYYGGAFYSGGCFEWRNRNSDSWLPKVIAEEVEVAKDQWAPLRAGLFDGSLERFAEVKSAVDKSVADNYWRT